MPLGGAAAGAFGGDGDGELVGSVEFFSHHFSYRPRTLLAARYGNAADSAKKTAQRPNKPCVFHQETGLAPNRGVGKLAENEIPVAGVRRHTYNALGIVWHCDRDLPSQGTQYGGCQLTHWRLF